MEHVTQHQKLLTMSAPSSLTLKALSVKRRMTVRLPGVSFARGQVRDSGERSCCRRAYLAPFLSNPFGERGPAEPTRNRELRGQTRRAGDQRPFRCPSDESASETMCEPLYVEWTSLASTCYRW